MPGKRRFKPVVGQIKLNPDQAVLQCNCYDTGWVKYSETGYLVYTACKPGIALRSTWDRYNAGDVPPVSQNGHS
jgi:hypothetical protein